jgi:hypothetical protein
MFEVNNEVRADWAQHALDAFRAITHIEGEDTATAVSDLLIDLRHLCDRKNLDFDHIAERSSGAYEEETYTGEDRESDCGPKAELDDEGKENFVAEFEGAKTFKEFIARHADLPRTAHTVSEDIREKWKLLQRLRRRSRRVR